MPYCAAEAARRRPSGPSQRRSDDSRPLKRSDGVSASFEFPSNAQA